MSELKPIKKPKGLPVLQETRGISLTYVAAEMMASHAEAVSEGMVESVDRDDSIYRGSTLITINLDKPYFEIEKDETTLNQLKEAAERSVALHIRMVRLARLEAERKAAPLFVREMRAESTFRIVDKCLLVDIDIECPLAVAIGESDDAQGGRQ